MTHLRFLMLVPLIMTANACTIVLKLYPTVETVKTSDIQQISGGRLRAAWVAASDLAQQVEKNQKAAPKPNEIMLCFARIESYDLKMEPQSERCVAPPARLMGGGATYEIDKQELKILSQEHAE